MFRITVSLLVCVFAFQTPVLAQDFDPDYTGTYSIVALDPDTGELGMGVQSRAFAVGNRTWTAKGGLAVFAHQASSNPYYGRIGMELLAAGLSPEEALDRLVKSDDMSARRQVAVIDVHGRTAAHTGSGASDWKGHKCGENYCAQGNTLAGPEVVEGLARTFEATEGQPLAERLLAALDAAQAAGGDVRGVQGASLVVVKPLGGAGQYSDSVIDVRVDDHPEPLVELRRLLKIARSRDQLRTANETFNAGEQQKALQTVLALRDGLPMKDNIWVALASMYLRMDRKADALEAIRRAVELNPANKRQLPRNTNFESIRTDPDFLRIVGQ